MCLCSRRGADMAPHQHLSILDRLPAPLLQHEPSLKNPLVYLTLILPSPEAYNVQVVLQGVRTRDGGSFVPV